MDTALQGFPSVPLYLPFDATLAFHLNDVNDVTIGFGFYGAFGGSLTQGEDFFATDPEDPDDRDESVVSESRTGGHFFAVSVGVSAQHGDFRPQGWFRFTSVSDWRDTLSYLFGEGTDGDPLHHFTDFTEGLAKTVGVSGGFRMPIEVSESVTIIPAVAAGFGTATTFQTDRLDTWDTDLVESDPPSVSTAVDFSGGVGVHYQATDKILAVFTVSANGTFSRLRDESFGDGDDDDYRLFVGGGDVFRLPVLSIGAEAKLLKHLTLRGCIRAGMVLGTTRSFSEFSDDNGFIEYSDGVANNATPQLSAAVGAAIPFEHVTVDLVLGGNLLSGESTDSFFSRVGVTFNLP